MAYKRALVTGGAGFIGSHIAEKLIQRGIETVVLDDLSVGKKENIPANAEFIKADICDPGVVKTALKGVEVVFHEAARVSIRDSFRGFFEDARANVMGTVNILKSIEGSGVKKFVYASSMAAYGDAKYLPIDEGHPLEPTSPYGVSKLASEKYILCFCQYAGISPIILRYFNTYGPRQTLSSYVGVITIFIQKLLSGEDLPIFGDGNQVRDFINADDIAEANLLAMNYSGPHQVFNVGTGVGTTVNSIAQILQEKMRKSSQVRCLPLQPGEPSSSVANITLARKELGFVPRWTLEEKISEVIEWNIKKAYGKSL